jgi:hypothetical protein
MPLYMYCQWVVFKKLIVGGFGGLWVLKISVTKEWTEHTTQNLLLWKYM